MQPDTPLAYDMSFYAVRVKFRTGRIFRRAWVGRAVDCEHAKMMWFELWREHQGRENAAWYGLKPEKIVVEKISSTELPDSPLAVSKREARCHARV